MRNDDLRIVAIAGVVITGLLAAPRLPAQSSPGEAGGPAFEVASVKPNKSGDGFSTVRFPPGGRFVATNMSLRDLIRLAYDIKDFQLSGGPDWLRSDRFDVEAKANGDISQRESWLMVRTLMADRFKLGVHTETRDAPIYALVLARKDGKLGPHLLRAEIDCAALRAEARGSTNAVPPGLPPPPRSGGQPRCGSNGGSPGRRAGGGVTLAELANNLSTGANRIVVDRTGLSGLFDYRLEWTPDQLPPPLPPDSASPRPDVPPPPPPAPVDGPSIFTAVQEQLGLKLESTRGPVDVLIIDRAERPSED